MSHCRRYFIESIPLDSREKEIFESNGAEDPFEEKKQKRQEASRPILDAFGSWVEATSALYTTNEMLTKALTYATNQKEYLETFMEDGRIPISNNLCEANIKTLRHSKEGLAVCRYSQRSKGQCDIPW